LIASFNMFAPHPHRFSDLRVVGVLQSGGKRDKTISFHLQLDEISDELLYTTIFTGRLCSRTVSSSPISMPSPPSPDNEMTWRSGNAAWAPMLMGSPLAIDPWANEPMIRRFGAALTYRAA